MILRTALAVAVLVGSTAPAQSIRVISDRPLPAEAVAARDIRWASDHSVYVSSYFAGVLQVATDTGTARRVGFAEPGRTCPSCSSLAASETHIVTAFPVHHLAWKNIARPQIHQFLFDAIVDIDVRGDRLLLLGSRTEGEKKAWAPDGAIGWVGSLERGLKDLRPVLFSSRGAKEMTIARCGFLEPGAVRFFGDGSFVIVPGVEPDVYLYDASGRLVYTWQTAKLGFFDACDLPESQVHALSADPEQRARWRSKRVMLDDVLPTPAGPPRCCCTSTATAWRDGR